MYGILFADTHFCYTIDCYRFTLIDLKSNLN